MQTYYYVRDDAGFQNLVNAVIIQACRDASKPGYTGYEARLWLEFTAIPYLEARKADVKPLYDLVIKPRKINVPLRPVDRVYHKRTHLTA